MRVPLRRVVLVSSVVAVVASSAAAPAVFASTAHHGTVRVVRTSDVTAHFDDPGWLTFVPQGCSARQTGLCTVTAEGMVVYTGGLDGFSEYHASGWFDPAVTGMRYQVWETFTGTVHGCGTGSTRWFAEGTITSAGFDPATMTTGFTQTWRILPGTSTGGLAGVTGSGTAAGTINVLTRENHGSLVGSLRCVPADA